MNIFIFDLDGTLAVSSKREQFPKIYDQNFQKSVLNDLPISKNIKKIKKITKQKILILIGRKSLLRAVTKIWLKKNGIKYYYIIMRPKSCNKSNTNFKLDIIKKIKKKFKIIKIFDDNQEFIKKVKSINIIFET